MYLSSFCHPRLRSSVGRILWKSSNSYNVNTLAADEEERSKTEPILSMFCSSGEETERTPLILFTFFGVEIVGEGTEGRLVKLFVVC